MTNRRAVVKPTTTQRGLGGAHRAERRHRLAQLRDGDPCARCQSRGVYHPMYRAQARWLDLDDFPGRAFGGPQRKRLSWASCNRRSGAALSTPLRLARLRMAARLATTPTTPPGPPVPLTRRW